MEKTGTDRRIARTRQFLQDALIELILEKGYEAITVQDLLDRANIGRSTFYSHYRDKEDLLLSGFSGLFERFKEQYQNELNDLQNGKDAAKQFSLYIFCHAEGHRKVFQAMFGRQAGDIVIRYAHQSLTEIVHNHLAGVYPYSRSVPLDITIHYLVSSFLSLLIWWLDRETPLTAEDMNRIYWDLVMPGVVKVFAPLV
jgi:AcrR family transcriptional regulator